MAADARIREVRLRNGTTFNTTHTNAATGPWAATNTSVIKARAISLDAGGLVYSAEADPTLYQQLYPSNAPIATIRSGNVKLGMFLEGAHTNTTDNPLASILSWSMGGVASAALRPTDAVETSSTATQINATAHGLTAGSALLVGARADGRANGEARVIETVTNANSVALGVALSGAPTNADTMVQSTTVYYHDTTQTYCDGYILGRSAEDHVQWVGAVGSVSLSDLSPGSIPKVEIDFAVGDWQEVASANRSSLSPTTSMAGNKPALNLGLGGFWLTDASGTTRTAFKISDLSISPLVTFEPLPDPNGINGKGGFVRVMATPTIEFTALLEGGTDPLPGFYDDFVAGTQKKLLAQFGHQAGSCVLIDARRFVFSESPTRTTVGNLAAVKCKGVCLAGAADLTVAATAKANSPLRIHFF